jgi:hypothetical protein
MASEAQVTWHRPSASWLQFRVLPRAKTRTLVPGRICGLPMIRLVLLKSGIVYIYSHTILACIGSLLSCNILGLCVAQAKPSSVSKCTSAVPAGPICSRC